MPKAVANPGCSSVLTLAKVTSGLAAEVFSKIGAKARHGPHQGAHQSTRTMPSSTVIPKFPGLSSFVAMAKVLSPSWSQYRVKGFGESAWRHVREPSAVGDVGEAVLLQDGLGHAGPMSRAAIENNG